MVAHIKRTPFQTEVYQLSQRIVDAQRPIRVLDAIKWGNETKEEFLKHKGKKLPSISLSYYQDRPLSFNPAELKEQFYRIERDIDQRLGLGNGVGKIMSNMCREYREVIRMLEARGTPEFSFISQELYGSVKDAFYPNAPTLEDLGNLLAPALEAVSRTHPERSIDEKSYTGESAVLKLGKHLAHYFNEHQTPRVKLSDDIIADASAGAECLKIRQDASFSERDLRVLEVHEGWVHLGTTLNGLNQPICTFLSKGPPSSTITQEGLAIITEVFTFSSFPDRLKRLTNRVRAIGLAENGADFIEVFRFFQEAGLDDSSAYSATTRIFRGSLPTGQPFTKDLAYSKGFILIYNYIRLAVQKGLLSRIPLLFVGKTNLEDLHILEDLVEEGLVVPPKYLPPPFQDLSGLSAWMCYSLFLNKLNLEELSKNYKLFLD